MRSAQRGYMGGRAAVQDCVVRLLSPQGKPAPVQPRLRTHAVSVGSARIRLAGWMEEACCR